MEKIEKKFKFTVNVRLDQGLEKELPEVMVYAFDNTGQYLASAPMPKDKQGRVELEFPSDLTGRTVRVVLGPPHVKELEEMPQWMAELIRRDEVEKEVPSLAGLLRKGGYEKRFRLAAGSIIEIAVYPPDWKKWLLCPCVIRGRVVKHIPLPDGTTRELGVCHACVKIYEVDKFPKIILQLPERDLFRLRDDLMRVLEKQLSRSVTVFPPPPPPPPEEITKAAGQMTIASPGEAPILPSSVYTPIISVPSPGIGSILKTEPLLSGDQLKAQLEPIFRASSVSQLRSALVAKAEVLAVYICAFEWLRYWFHSDLIKCACTDEQGRFQTIIWYKCAGDKPDLYFKAVQCIGGALHTLYDPGVACNTYWDYACGSEVVLETNDPAAIICVPPEPVEVPSDVSVWVMPWGVGNIRLDSIKQPSGLTDLSDSNGKWIDIPFGSTLGFRLGYSGGIPYDVPGMPAYYRWLYNRLEGNNETEWREFATPVAETVTCHYMDYDLALGPHPIPTYPAYPLGPQEKKGMNVYEFKPHQPPYLAGHHREWPPSDWFADIYSAILNSANLPGGLVNAAGKYKIKLEVYDKDGYLITPGAGTFDFIVPNGLAPDGKTIIPRKALANEIEGSGFVFYLHVDNNKCEADIYDASLNGVPAGSCGFIGYGPGDDVHLSFKAEHPNGFARFKFTVVRGSSGYVTAASAPANPDAVAWANAPLVTDSLINGFARNASSIFAKEVDEAIIRGGCPKAAFGENLYVAAAVTNGWVRLSGLDASALPKAFALEPKTI